MSVQFEPKLIRRHTQHWFEEEPVNKGLWSRLSGQLTFLKSQGISTDGDVEWNGDKKDAAELVDPRDDLYRIMVSSRPRDEVLTLCWRWYLSYLELQIKESWNSILVPILPDLPSHSAVAPSHFAKVFLLLGIIAAAISRGTEKIAQTEITLDNIVGEIKEHKDNFASPKVDINHIRQLVWCLAGPLTMLFDPKLPKITYGQLQLRRPASSKISRRRHRSVIITSFSRPMNAAEEPFYRMLTEFGTLFPTFQRKRTKDANKSHFYPSDISYDVLKTVADLKIEWVNTLNLHLQLDERKRILRVFRFPAFCRLLYADGVGEDGQPNRDRSFLCQLFDHHKASRVQAQPQEGDFLTFHDYFRDMILSYRVLFGMKEKSRKAFKDELQNWRLDKAHDGPFSGHRLYEMIDPLLWHLCTDTSESPMLQELLSSLDGEETSPRYAFEDFPFLGRRLQDLENFMEGHKPTGLQFLWQDRRDPQNWWITWTAAAVLVIGGGTIVLQFWQLVFQIMSTFYHNGGGS